MALEAVSPASSATGPAPSGAAGIAGAAAAASSGTPGAGPPGAQPSGGGGVNFLQMLTQSSSATGAVNANAKPADSSTSAKSAADDQTAALAAADANSVAIALALASQAIAQPQTPMAATPKFTASASSQEGGGAAASTSAIGAPGSIGSTATGSATDGVSMQSLMALLTQDADSDPGPTPPSGSTGADGSASGSSGTASTEAGAASGPTVANPHMGVGSHFAIPHSADDARAIDVKSPIGTPAWADELSGKITWMAHQGIESASLRLSPEHLGPVEVRISVQDGATSLMFGAAQADTRSAIEQALPHLRAMFATQGLQLADAGVSREPPKEQPKPAPVAAISAIAGVGEQSVSVSSARRIGLGLLDTYA